MTIKHRLFNGLSIIAVLAMVFTGPQPTQVSAQDGDGLTRQINAESGRVSFISSDGGKPLSALQALGTSVQPQDPAMALAKRFAPEFGVRDPERDLAEMKKEPGENGRLIVRYQQKYQGIPVMGGELIVSTNDNGDLYSVNGEVSPDLSIQTQPAIDATQAREKALQSLAKWYQKDPEDFTATEPELWIFDESLLQPSTRLVELVWRMEVTPRDAGMPLRELVLVNAERGGISLHFNQVDTAWSASLNSDVNIQEASYTPTPEPTEIPPIPDSESSQEPEPEETPLLTTDEPMGAPAEMVDAQSEELTGTWYVATTGSDAGSCSSASDPCATINSALGKASAGDTILVSTGTYTGTGDQVVLIDKSINLSGGWDSIFSTQTGLSIINGESTRQGVYVKPQVTAVLDHFEISNGRTINFGGGIYNAGDLTLDYSLISNNYGYGAGIYNLGKLAVYHSSIANNSSPGSGGGIYNRYILNIFNSTIHDNQADGDGGGIKSFEGSVNVYNTTISNNSAGDGGAIQLFYALNTNLRNVTIYGNTALGYGGGIYATTGSIQMQNSILAGNTNGWEIFGTDCSGVIISGGYNLIGDGTACSFSPAVGDQVGTTSTPVYPRLGLLQDNGGPTLTQALLQGSPAIDKGNPAIPGSSNKACLAMDQRGAARPAGARCDIGAYEGSVSWTPLPLVETYTANKSYTLPGSLLCNQTDPGCTNGDSHARAAHKYAMGVYNFFATKFSRDSIDNNGMTIKSSVHYCSQYYCPYANASWSGEQIVYGDVYGYSLADDVVAHELTHGVTQYESNLFYYYQSGAINESFSDLWGEYYDQVNGAGNDSVNVRWIIGEDVSGYPVPAGFSVPATRSMSNPPALGDPDKMSSPNYYKGQNDNGGVHWNSGLNNKAVYLMVDGGVFNGRTVNALGWEKVTAIYYEVNTSFLTSGADYSDLYYALQQACASLIGQKGITAVDCTEVKDAINAVEMNGQPATNFNTDAPYCDGGSTPTIIFSEDLEGGGDGTWMYSSPIGSSRWQLASPYGPFAHSGVHMMYADDYPPARTDTMIELDLNEIPPEGIFIPPNAFMRFSHAYGFEDYNGTNYDGGVFQYRGTGYSSSEWKDAGSMFINNGYNGTIVSNYGNPLAGK